MIKSIIKAIYYAFISIFLISLILAGWTSYAFISQPSKSSQISKVIKDIYSSQKLVVINLIDLSKILIKDTDVKITNHDSNLFQDKDSFKDVEDDFQIDESLIIDDKPLNIIIEPSTSDLGENIIPKLNEEELIND